MRTAAGPRVPMRAHGVSVIGLRPHDRCDAEAVHPARAVAYVQLTSDPGSALTLCGHHWDVHADAIMALDPYAALDGRLT